MLQRVARRLTLVTVVGAVLASCFALPAAAASFEAETLAATNVGDESATLNGSVFKSDKNTAVAGYDYGTTTEYGSESEPIDLTGESGTLEVPITVEDLEPNTTYHFRVGIADGEEVVYGEDMTFKTTTSFEAETLTATSVGAYSATLNGSIFKKYKAFGMAGYEYGTTTEYGSESEPIFLTGESGTIEVPFTVEGLEPNTTYHYRVGVVGNNGKVFYGKDLTVTTAQHALFAPSPLLGSYPLLFELESIEDDPITFELEGGDFSCESLTAVGTETFSLLDVGKGNTTKVAMAPSFEDCVAGLGWPATVDVNGCEFVLRAGDSGTASGALDITCPEGESIEVTAISCEFSIPAQGSLTPVSETNDDSTESDSVRVEPDAGGVTYVKEHDGYFCPFNGTGAMNDGALSGGVALMGSKEGTPVDVEIINLL